MKNYPGLEVLNRLLADAGSTPHTAEQIQAMADRWDESPAAVIRDYISHLTPDNGTIPLWAVEIM